MIALSQNSTNTNDAKFGVSISKNRVFTLLLTMLIATMGVAFAATNNGLGLGGLTNVLGTIVGTLTGDGGKIITACAIAWGLFQITQQNWIQVIGSFLGALVLNNIEELVNGAFSATVNPELAAVATNIVTTVAS